METAIDTNAIGTTESNAVAAAAAAAAAAATAITKKLNKKKNKLKNRGTSRDKCTKEIDQTMQSLNNDGIQDVSEELLTRLQLNGTSVSRITNRQTANNASDSESKSLKQIKNSANDTEANVKQKSQQKQHKHQQHQRQKQLNNNNNRAVFNKNNNNNQCKHEDIVNSGHVVEMSSSHQVNGNYSKENEEIAAESGAKSDIGATTICHSVRIDKSKLKTLTCTNKEKRKSQLPAAATTTTSNVIESNVTSVSNQGKCYKHRPEQRKKSVSSVNEVERSPSASSSTSSSLLCSTISMSCIKTSNTTTTGITFNEYENELQMSDIMRVIEKELSEPYSIYTYRYFIHNWPKLCFLAMDGDKCIGAIVCKLDIHRQRIKRGYIAMLAVDAVYRKLKVGTTLVRKAIEAMLAYQADEVVLETEITNTPALRLYENLGFVRDKRLFDYYLNGVDALRLKLWFK